MAVKDAHAYYKSASRFYAWPKSWRPLSLCLMLRYS